MLESERGVVLFQAVMMSPTLIAFIRTDCFIQLAHLRCAHAVLTPLAFVPCIGRGLKQRDVYRYPIESNVSCAFHHVMII